MLVQRVSDGQGEGRGNEHWRGPGTYFIFSSISAMVLHHGPQEIRPAHDLSQSDDDSAQIGIDRPQTLFTSTENALLSI
jgi:hypothetical protein